MRKFKKSLLASCFLVVMFAPIYCFSNDVDISFQWDNLSDYYVVAGDWFYWNVPYNLFSWTFIANNDWITIESISWFISISVDWQPNAITDLSLLSDMEMRCSAWLGHDNRTITLDDQWHADIYVDLSRQNFRWCTIKPGNTHWNIILTKSSDVAVDTVVDWISLSIDSISYKDENDELRTLNISKTIQWSTIHFVEKDPYAPKIIFNQPDDYVPNDVVNIWTFTFDALWTDWYEIPIFSNSIELLNADSITTDSLHWNAIIYIDNALANRSLSNSFLFRFTFWSCDYVTNRWEGVMVDENWHAEVKLSLWDWYCTISQKNNTFKISAIARGGASLNGPSSITTSWFLFQNLTYRKWAWHGTIEVNKLIPGTNLYIVREDWVWNEISNKWDNNITSDIPDTWNTSNMDDNNTSNDVSDTWNTNNMDDNNSSDYSVFRPNYSIYNPNYSDEMNEAYQYAYKYWITTMNQIEKAKMNSPLTRIAMAKMLSKYATSVLWKKPDISKTCSFNDVTLALDSQYDNWVTTACQLWIMWIWIKNFKPNGLVTRAEFATALSRLLYWTQDWTDKYYSTHISTLYNKWIISNTNHSLIEKRWYVMLMLMRSAN